MLKSQDSIRLGDVIPNFEADSTHGKCSLYQVIGDKSYGLLFSHPADFTPVCTTELATAEKYRERFEKMNCKLAAISCDDADSHREWLKDIEIATGVTPKYPIFADPDRKIAMKLGMLNQDHLDKKGVPLTVRKVFLIGPDRKVKLTITYPASTGRNFDELLRVTRSVQLTANEKLATPANWNEGEKCVCVPGLSTKDAKSSFEDFEMLDLPSGKEYMHLSASLSAIASRNEEEEKSRRSQLEKISVSNQRRSRDNGEMIEEIKRVREQRFRIKRMLKKIGQYVQRRERRHRESMRETISKNRSEMERVKSLISSTEARSISLLSLARKEQASIDAFKIKLSAVSPPTTPSSFSEYVAEQNRLKGEIRELVENIENSIQTLSKKPSLTMEECNTRLAAYCASWVAQGAMLSAQHASTLAEACTLDQVTSNRVQTLRSEEDQLYLNVNSRIASLEAELDGVRAHTSELRMRLKSRKASASSSNTLTSRQNHVLERTDMWLQKKHSELQNKHQENLTKVENLSKETKRKKDHWTQDHSSLLRQSQDVKIELTGLLDSVRKLAAQIGTMAAPTSREKAELIAKQIVLYEKVTAAKHVRDVLPTIPRGVTSLKSLNEGKTDPEAKSQGQGKIKTPKEERVLKDSKVYTVSKVEGAAPTENMNVSCESNSPETQERKSNISKRQDGDIKIEPSRVVISQTEDVGWIHHHEQNKHEADEVTTKSLHDVTPLDKEDMKVPVDSSTFTSLEESSLKLDEHAVEDKHEADVLTPKSSHDVTPRVKETMNVPIDVSTFTSLEESSLKLDEHEVEDKHEADEVTTK
eukprot:g6103.t1